MITMDRLTDKRFVGDGFYQPKNHEERLEIFANVPKLRDIYNRLAEYEDTGLTPDEINNRKMIPMTFESISISPKAERAMIGVENALLYQIKKLKSCVKSDNSDYLTGYLSALSAVEGIIEEEKSENNDQT